MEDISPIYEDVDICAWAQDIRLAKTRELEISLDAAKKALQSMIEFYYPERFKVPVIEDINRLQEKLNILKR